MSYRSIEYTVDGRIAMIFDGVARHSPEGMWWEERAEQVGFSRAVAERDSGEPIAPGASRLTQDLAPG